MNDLTRTRSRLEAFWTARFALPAILALNTAALLALDQLGGLPDWIKTATALFLAF